MKRLITSLLLLMAAVAGAQNFEKVWEKALAPFYRNSLDISVEVIVYKNSYLIGIESVDRIRYRKSGDVMSVSAKAYDQLVTRDITIMADHYEKVLMLAPTLAKNGFTTPLQLDSLVRNGKKVFGSIDKPLQIKDQAGLTGYVFNEPDNDLQKLEVWFDESRSELKKLILYPVGTGEAATTAAIAYQFVYHADVPDKSFLSSSRFGVRKNKKFTPSAPFRNYSILNQL